MKKKAILLLFTLLGLTPILLSQTVDSIKVEQSGDFIKVRYKILNSRPDQLFRVKVLCSINGGLNTELRSVSGDTGENIVGGKPEYFVVWDVLKDVEELTSVEFIIRADLISDLSSMNINQGSMNAETLKWSKKRFNLMPAAQFPGAKVGFRIGYMGSFGILGQMVHGNAIIKKGISVPIGMTTEFEPEKYASLSLDITKRIVNSKGFQMHLIAGVLRTQHVFRDDNAFATPYHHEKVFGPEAGFAFGVRWLSMTFMFTHVDPGQVEKTSDYLGVSPTNYITTCFGVRF
jgi:hypothetical protein